MIEHRLYVGTIGAGLWRSSDGGASFQRCEEGLFLECQVRALAVDPQRPERLWLANEEGLFRSADGGDSWQPVPGPWAERTIWSLLLAPADPEVLLVGTCPAQLLRSGDGGRTWSVPVVQLPRDCPRLRYHRVTALVADPHDPQLLWAGVEVAGLRRSQDGGRTWQEVAGAGLSSLDIHALAVVPVWGRSRLLAATNNDLNISLDAGDSWRPVHIARFLPWSYCRALAQPLARPLEVLLGNGNGPPGSAGIVARSTDGGDTWQSASMPGLANSTIWNFAVHPADPQLLYASSISGEVYVSTTAGASWEKLPREFGEIRALAWAPT
jgi:photosystem II stability/assembly factor-like uncharacterized protein